MSFSHQNQPARQFSGQSEQAEGVPKPQSSSSSHGANTSDAPTHDLASWVNQVRQRDSASTFTRPTDESSSPSALDLEFQRQRLERQQRRDRLSVSGIRGISGGSNPATSIASPILEKPASIPSNHDQISTMAPLEASQSPTASAVLGSSPTKASNVTGVKRANSLLARYGGQYGPTGVAAGPKGPADSPVSLANFMGGKASGPRMGKLAGDGKSAPPEAGELIHESRRVPLPGMAPNSGRSLASFLEERADATGNCRSAGDSPSSPTKELSAPASPGKVTAPAKYSFTSAELGRPTKTWSDPATHSVISSGASIVPTPSSPKKAYLDLIEKQNAAQTSAPSSPTIPRASSPSKFHRFTGVDSAATSPLLNRPASPVKGVFAASPLLDETSNSLTSTAGRNGDGTRSSHPLPIPHAQSHSYSSSPERKDAATSPFKAEDILASSAVAATKDEPKSDAGLGRDWSRPTAQADSASWQAPSRSTSFASSDIAGTDRIPTASLSRLSAKKMVGQRIKEAQLRDQVAQQELDSMQVGTPGRSIPSSPAVRDRWPPASQTNVSPVRSSFDDRKAEAPWSPTKYGNALPGLAGRSPTKESGSSTWQPSSPKKTIAADPRAEPQRLPGMGAGVSPFARHAEMRQKEGAIALPDSPESTNAASNSDQVLTSLTKARAKGPMRKAAASADVKAAATESTSSVQASAPQTKEKDSKSVSKKPPRRTTGKRVHVLVSGSGSNLQALIDATLLDPPPGMPVIDNAQITFVLSNRKAAYSLTRAAESNPPIPTKVLALKTWQNRNPGGTREQYDQVLARAVLDGPSPEGTGTPPDLIVLAGFMHIVSEPFLHALGHKTSLPANTPTLGPRPPKAVPIINLHPALPKAFDGANAIPRAFEACKQGLTDKTGCMVHEVVADVDRGRPILVREVPILPSYDLEQLEQAIHKIEHIIICQAADLVLKGHLEELDRREAEKQKPVARAPVAKESPSDVIKVGPLDASDDVLATSAAIVRDSRAALAKAASVSISSRSGPVDKTISVEVLSIDADGFAESVEFSGDQTFQRGEQLRREQILYDDETLAVVRRFKSESGLVETKLWVRTGQRSALHPFELGPLSTSCAEGRKVLELAQRYSVKPKMIPAGCESADLIASLSGTWVVSRHGSRKRFDASGTSLYRIRPAVGSAGQESFAIQQVDLRTANLCSADSFVFSILSSVGVWHGRGAAEGVRAAARRFAQALVKSSTGGARAAQEIAEVVEGSEDSLFWNVFDKTERYASGWHHRHSALAHSDDSIILDVELRGRSLQFVPWSTKGYFGADDLLLPTRAAKISVLNLRDRELFVVVGKEARSDRVKLACAIRAAEELATQLQSKSRSGAASSATVVPRPAVHVLVLPSKLPCEVRAASRVWSDEVVQYLQGSSASSMNVLSSTSALDQLGKRSWPRWALQDLDSLPIGVGPEDAKTALV